MTNYDKSLDSIAKDQKKAKFQAKKKAAAQASKKAKLAKGGKKKGGPIGKNRNNAPMKPVGGRRNPPRGAKNGAGNPRQAGAKLAKALRQAVPKAGLKSASALAKRGGINTGVKVHVDNLDFGVTEKDMRELFGEFGGLKTVQMHFNAQGKSQGVCDIHFKNKQDGLRAVKKYNNVPLDGRRMKIDVIGQPNAGGAAPVVKSKVQAAKAAASKKRVSPVKKQQQKKGQVGKASPNKQSPKKKILLKKKAGAGGKKAPAKKEAKKQVTEEDLDKQLDAYLAAGAI